MIDRPTVRMLVIDERERILLLGGFEHDGPGRYWITPGGGVEAGETLEQAARRELFEETGCPDGTLGPLVWTREFAGRLDGANVYIREWAHLVRVNTFEPNTSGFTDVERMENLELRWWTAADLETTRDRLVPRELAVVLRGILDSGVPDPPLTL